MIRGIINGWPRFSDVRCLELSLRCVSPCSALLHNVQTITSPSLRTLCVWYYVRQGRKADLLEDYVAEGLRSEQKAEVPGSPGGPRAFFIKPRLPDWGQR